MDFKTVKFKKTGELLHLIAHCPICVVTWDLDYEPDPGCPHESPDPVNFVFPGDDLYDNHWTVVRRTGGA